MLPSPAASTDRRRVGTAFAAQAKIVPYKPDKLAVGLSAAVGRDVTVGRELVNINIPVIFKFDKTFRIPA
jgi:hypothetical protein